MAGLVVLDIDLEVIQQVPAVSGDAEEVDPGAVGAAGPAGGLRARSAWPGPPDPLPDRGEPVVPGRGERTDRDRDLGPGVFPAQGP